MSVRAQFRPLKNYPASFNDIAIARNVAIFRKTSVSCYLHPACFFGAALCLRLGHFRLATSYLWPKVKWQTFTRLRSPSSFPLFFFIFFFLNFTCSTRTVPITSTRFPLTFLYHPSHCYLPLHSLHHTPSFYMTRLQPSFGLIVSFIFGDVSFLIVINSMVQIVRFISCNSKNEGFLADISKRRILRPYFIGFFEQLIVFLVSDVKSCFIFD